MPEPAIIIAIIALIGSIASSIPTLLRLRGEYKEQAANASASNVDTAIKLKAWLEEELRELKERCTAMETEMRRQEDEITDLRRRVRALSRYANALILQILDIGIEPVVSLQELSSIMEADE